jgi:hypothetical protein
MNLGGIFTRSVVAIVLAALTFRAMDAVAQTRKPNQADSLRGFLAAFRASPLHTLGKIRLQNVKLVEKTPVEILEWLNRQIVDSTISNAPGVRIEVRPVDLTIPPYSAALEPAITGQIARIRKADVAWRATIASNSLLRLTIEGQSMTALDVLKTCCTQADLQYADSGRDIVVGNVYFLRWPPVLACRVFQLSEKLVKELGDSVKDVIAPAPFHDYSRDWMTLVPEQNALVVFHHPDMLDAFATSVEFANANADELIVRQKPPPPLGGKK